MRNFISKFIIILAIILFNYSISTAIACTDITITANDGTVMVGRTLEFGPDLQSNIISSPRDKVFKTTAPNGKPGMGWTSKYGYLFLDYFNLGYPCDGMNEKGLSLGYLYLPGYTQYPTVPQGKENHSIPYTNFADWILGNFSSVADLKAALKNVIVYAKPLTVAGQNNIVFPVHVIVTDQQGNSIVIEFAKGKMQVYDDKLGILTNSPLFPWQMTNLKNFANLSPYSPKTINVDGYTYSGTGQGSGMVGLPGDTSPPSRFVKMAWLTKTALPVDDAMGALILAKHIINTVDIPRGLVRGEKGTSTANDTETTQWTVFKDLKHHILYFTSYNNSTLQAIDLNKVDFTKNASPLKMPVASKQIIVNAIKAGSRGQAAAG